MTELIDSLQQYLAGPWGALGVTAFRVALILTLAIVLQRIVTRVIRAARLRIAARLPELEQQRRAETIGRVLRYLASLLVALVAGVALLSELGISVAPILGAAGVVGLAIGFGAQSLVKDFFSGMCLLLENQVAKGDVVRVADLAGVVEDVTLRYVQLRDYDGNVHFVPTGLITTVTNMSRGHACAVMDVGVAYREDLDHVYDVLSATAEAMRNDPAHSARILEPLEIAGVEQWADSAVVVRCRFKVRPLEQWTVRREFLRRLKAAFDAAGIEIPYPHLTLYAGEPRSGAAPALPINARIERPRAAAR